MKKILILIYLLINTFIFSETIEEIMGKIDENMSPQSMIYKGEMVIYKKNKESIKKMTAYILDKDAYVEFTYPKRDKGTKYLKIDDNLWIYFPKVEKPQKLSGHMLRQSMMGSDFSYEDSTEKDGFLGTYNGKILESSESEYIIELRSKEGVELSYDIQKIWVDRGKYVITKAEMYAQSGKLLKESISLEIKKVGNKYYPVKIKMDDKLRRDTYTIFEMKDIELNVEIDKSIFTLKNLERK